MRHGRTSWLLLAAGISILPLLMCAVGSGQGVVGVTKGSEMIWSDKDENGNQVAAYIIAHIKGEGIHAVKWIAVQTPDGQLVWLLRMGKVVSISSDSITWTDSRSSEQCSNRIAKETKFFRDKIVTSADLKRGMFGKGTTIAAKDIRTGDEIGILAKGADNDIAASEIMKGGILFSTK